MGSREFIDEIKDRFLKGTQKEREPPALKDIPNRPELEYIEHVVNSALQSDEKIARQIKLHLCHRFSGRKLRKTGEWFGVSESGVTQASRRIRIKQKNDKKVVKISAEMVRELILSNGPHSYNKERSRV